MRPRRRAFTLIELMMVITIMGIIISFIIRASIGGIRRAEEKATISLIVKLEGALTDRVDALSSDHPEPTAFHTALGAIYNSNAITPANPTGQILSPQRAQVLAYYDNLRAELPDVFVVQSTAVATQGLYPLNFGAAVLGGVLDNGLLPAGPLSIGIRSPLGADGGTFPVTGMYGASFAAAAGIYSQLGYAAMGTDGNDNNGDGYTDDALEGLSGLTVDQVAQINARLANHKHKTARAEMLYAILVNGTGPFGSSFSREDFTKNEVQDTDNDGLLEFVDSWGEPVQFYRWPILYRSDTQRGFPDTAKIGLDVANGAPMGPYLSVFEAREVNTLDPNQILLSPAWWTNGYNSGTNPSGLTGDATTNASAGALAFQTFFHSLIDPAAASTGTTGLVTGTSINTYWERADRVNAFYGKIYSRRAYYNRFLVLSAGQDKIPGTAQLGVNYASLDERSAFPLVGGGSASSRDATGGPVPVLAPATTIGGIAAYVVQIENQAGRVDPNRTGAYYGVSMPGHRNDTNTFLEDVGNDDITSQNVNAMGGPLQ